MMNGNQPTGREKLFLTRRRMDWEVEVELKKKKKKKNRWWMRRTFFFFFTVPHFLALLSIKPAELHAIVVYHREYYRYYTLQTHRCT